MASVQERLQMKRVPLENWSISEQLYLASAVACSGDQNWMSVSRSLKMLCGHNRPSDWFSQKSCAAQYEMLLENVETPKRKKRNEKDTSQTIVETPIELIVRKLTQERIAELNKLLQEERDEYIKFKEEIVGIQNNRYEDNQLREMLAQIDAEEKQRERDKIKYTQWLKEREERKREMEKAWRSNANLLHQSPVSNVHSPTINQHLSQKVKIEEMEVDDPNSKQGTSPLLTSLLKSPSAAPNPSPSMLHNISNAQTRVAAPTITNLLTGSVTNLSNSLAAVAQQTTSKSVATSVTSISTAFPSQIQNQPLTGPAPNDQSFNNITQSPSQAAPTLSMLLESKQKDHHKLNLTGRIETPQQSIHQIVQQSKSFASTSDITTKAEPIDTDINNAAESEIKDEEQQLMEVFSDMIPDEFDELANIILDGLISEEQVSTVATVAESFVGQENLDLNQSQENTSVTDATVKEEPSNINENACDASDLTEPKIDIPTPQIVQIEENIDRKIEIEFSLKDEDSSDLSNDTPLSELIKQDASAKQQQLKLQSPVTVSDVKKEEPIESGQLLEVEPEQNIHDDLAVLSEEAKVEESQSQNVAHMEMDEIKEEIESENEQNETKIIDLSDENAQNEPNDSENILETSNTEEEPAKVNIELIPIDSSDSSDDKSIENIKREIEALPELKDSNESSPAPPDEKPAEEAIEKETTEIVHEPKASRSNSRKESARKSDIKNESKNSIKTENAEKSIIVDGHKIEEKEFKNERKSPRTEAQENIATTEKTEVQNKFNDSVTVNEPMETAEDAEKQETQQVENEIGNSIEENTVETVEIIDDTLDDVSEMKNASSSTAENNDEKAEGAQEADTSMKGEAPDEKDRKSDDSRRDSVILIEESDDVSTDKNTTSSTSKSNESSESADNKEKSIIKGKSVIGEIQYVKGNPVRKASSDEEVFEDAKENLDEVIKTSETELEKPSVPPPIITVDTDDDALFMEVAKEDKVGRIKRDYSRRKQDPNQSVERREDPTEDAVNSGSISSRLRTKDRDRSESPFVEEDAGEPSAKYRRRYSTTPLIDSLPNSPASSDDREYRSWKKSILLVYNSLAAHRCASMFSKPITEEQAPNYKTIILNPMDLHTLKRNIDSGIIRTTNEFKRFVMLMCHNSIFYNINDPLTCTRAKDMLNDALSLIRDFTETWKKENEKPAIPTPINSTAKGRGRKSNRLAN